MTDDHPRHPGWDRPEKILIAYMYIKTNFSIYYHTTTNYPYKV